MNDEQSVSLSITMLAAKCTIDRFYGLNQRKCKDLTFGSFCRGTERDGEDTMRKAVPKIEKRTIAAKGDRKETLYI